MAVGIIPKKKDFKKILKTLLIFINMCIINWKIHGVANILIMSSGWEMFMTSVILSTEFAKRKIK